MRVLKNGKIAFPIKGRNPPPCPDGYYPDPKNKWQCIPNVPCVFRQLAPVESCCSSHEGLYCMELEQIITLADCKDCDLRKGSHGDTMDDAT